MTLGRGSCLPTFHGTQDTGIPLQVEKHNLCEHSSSSWDSTDTPGQTQG